jgi:acetolactate decarboxylase
MIRRSMCAAALVMAAGCASATRQQGTVVPQNPSTTVWQLSPFYLLVNGHFDGVVTAREVAGHGNMGLSAADELAGEMAVVNGQFYQFGPGGAVVTPPPSLTLPFAEVTRWSGGVPLQLASGQTFDGSSLPDVDARLPTTDAFYALVLTGTWSVVQARTFKRQTPPYQRINASMQDTFTIRNVRGTMVGFRQPRYVDSLSVQNYHLHFVSEDGTRGGHVRGFTAGADVRLEYSLRPYFTLYMPPVAPADAAASAPLP